MRAVTTTESSWLGMSYTLTRVRVLLSRIKRKFMRWRTDGDMLESHGTLRVVLASMTPNPRVVWSAVKMGA